MYHISYRVELNDEERRLVDKTDLGKRVLYVHDYHDATVGTFDVTVRNACKPQGKEHSHLSLDQLLAEEEMIKEAFANLGRIFKGAAGGRGDGKEEVIEF